MLYGKCPSLSHTWSLSTQLLFAVIMLFILQLRKQFQMLKSVSQGHGLVSGKAWSGTQLTRSLLTFGG